MSVISSAHIERFGSMEHVFVKLYAGDFYKICGENLGLVKIRQKYRARHVKT